MAKVKTTGLADLDRALGDLKAISGSTSGGKGVLRRVGRQALAPVDEAWRARAPHLTGELEESGTVGSRLSRSQRAEHQRDSVIEVFAGPGPNPQGIQQEFGNDEHEPQPFLRPAWEENKDQVLTNVGELLGPEIDKATTRARRKAERAALSGR